MQVVDPANLWLAWRQAAKGKRRRANVARFSLGLEMALVQLACELREGTYRPGGYRQFTIHDGKPRRIAAAPFRDRVVHHALMQVVEPLFEAVLLPHCWACRKGKGTHGAVRTYQRWARRYAYALKMDVAQYFASIDQGRLLAKVGAIIQEPKVVALFARIIGSYETAPGKGLPLGNLTSQILGNLYLHEVDCLITEQWGHTAYLRYVDDLIVLDDEKRRLWALCEAVGTHVQQEGLALHPRKISVTPTRSGVDVSGYRVFPRHIRLRPGNGYRARRRLKRKVGLVAQGLLRAPELQAALQAWLGHAHQAETHGLRRTIVSGLGLTWGVCDTSGVAGRGLEQQSTEPPLGQPQQERTR